MIKSFIKRINGYWKATILTPTYVMGEVVLEVLIPILMAKLIDNGIDAGNMEYILKIGAVLVVLGILSLLCGAMSGKNAAYASAGFAKNLRRDMYYNVQTFSFSNIDRFSTSSLVTRLTTDIANVQMSFQMIIRVAVRCPVMLVFALIMSFNVRPELAIIFLGVIPVLALGLFLIMKSAYPIFSRVFKKYDKLNKIVQENLHGIRVVKSFVREDHEKDKFGQSSEDIYQDFSKAEKIVAMNGPLMQTCIYGCMLLIAWFGARLIITTVGTDNPMTTGQLMSLITYAMQILMSLMFLSMIFIMIIISKASAERITEVLEEKSNLTNPENPVYEVKDGSISFKQVDFSYNQEAERKALEEITVEIKSGETVGIIGGTGSSKSTLVQLIPRLYDVTGGSITVGGKDVREYDIETLRNEVAMVLQKNTLFSGTIKDNLRWGNDKATDEELIAACKLAQADEFINTFPDGYDTHIEQGGSNVSGGQKQRICIARALLKKPKILILDDSTSAVDTRTDALIRQAMRQEIPGTTKLIIAQRTASVEDADKIIVLEGGRVDGIGTHEELLQKNAIYREVYESQNKIAQ